MNSIFIYLKLLALKLSTRTYGSLAPYLRYAFIIFYIIFAGYITIEFYHWFNTLKLPSFLSSFFNKTDIFGIKLYPALLSFNVGILLSAFLLGIFMAVRVITDEIQKYQIQKIPVLEIEYAEKREAAHIKSQKDTLEAMVTIIPVEEIASPSADTVVKKRVHKI